jgi:hypothetical protein
MTLPFLSDCDHIILPMNSQDILDCISSIRAERNTEKRLRMLQSLNDSLPDDVRLQMPSLITNAYVRRALDVIEERISLSA